MYQHEQPSLYADLAQNNSYSTRNKNVTRQRSHWSLQTVRRTVTASGPLSLSKMLTVPALFNVVNVHEESASPIPLGAGFHNREVPNEKCAFSCAQRTQVTKGRGNCNRNKVSREQLIKTPSCPLPKFCFSLFSSLPNLHTINVSPQSSGHSTPSRMAHQHIVLVLLNPSSKPQDARIPTAFSSQQTRAVGTGRRDPARAGHLPNGITA